MKFRKLVLYLCLYLYLYYIILYYIILYYIILYYIILYYIYIILYCIILYYIILYYIILYYIILYCISYIIFVLDLCEICVDSLSRSTCVYQFECYACAVPVRLCSTALLHKFEHSCLEVSRKSRYYDHENAQNVSVLGKKFLIRDMISMLVVSLMNLNCAETTPLFIHSFLQSTPLANKNIKNTKHTYRNCFTSLSDH